jgi:cobalt-zinc-cadmium efflux system membrane fusion protein
MSHPTTFIGDKRVEKPAESSAVTVVGRFGRMPHYVVACIPGVLAFAMAVSVVALGMGTGWKLPKYSVLFGAEQASAEDWCVEHSVPESQCVECVASCLPRGREFGWCKKHGVSECPLCHPEVAQLHTPYVVTQEDLDRADRSLSFATRTENNSRCKLHQRRIQLASASVGDRLDIEVTQVRQDAVTEAITANGEIGFDPTRVARIASRTSGILWQVFSQAGDRVRRGDVLALVDAVQVGQRKAEFQQALFHLASARQNLEKVRGISGGVVAQQRLTEAEAEVEAAQVQLLAARQTLVNLGFPVRIEDYENQEPIDVTARMQYMGLPPEITAVIQGRTSSSNLLPIMAPLDGEILSRRGTTGETVDGSDTLFVIADTTRVWVTLHVRLEDAEHVRAGQAVQISHQGHEDWDTGVVAWVSPAADERSRTIPVRVELDNAQGRYHAQTFGTARIILREEPRALVVPNSAIHWDGDCHVVFVRDRNYDQPDSPKVYHVRKIRPGATDMIDNQAVTEIAVGVLPGEWIASANSGILRSELLRGNLGAG